MAIGPFPREKPGAAMFLDLLSRFGLSGGRVLNVLVFFSPSLGPRVDQGTGGFAVLPGDNRYRAMATFRSLVHPVKLYRVEPFRS